MSFVAPAATNVGHVHLRVADLDRAIAFYSEVLGFTLNLRYGTQAAFLGAGGYHHHIGLNTWDSLNALPPPKGHTGLYHAAFLYPDRASLARVYRSVLDAGYALTGWADHGVSVALYLDDPDGNGVELYYDRPHAEWPKDADGNLTMMNQRFDLDALLAHA